MYAVGAEGGWGGGWGMGVRDGVFVWCVVVATVAAGLIASTTRIMGTAPSCSGATAESTAESAARANAQWGWVEREKAQKGRAKRGAAVQRYSARGETAGEEEARWAGSSWRWVFLRSCWCTPAHRQSSHANCTTPVYVAYIHIDIAHMAPSCCCWRRPSVSLSIHGTRHIVHSPNEQLGQTGHTPPQRPQQGREKKQRAGAPKNPNTDNHVLVDLLHRTQAARTRTTTTLIVSVSSYTTHRSPPTPLTARVGSGPVPDASLSLRWVQ